MAEIDARYRGEECSLNKRLLVYSRNEFTGLIDFSFVRHDGKHKSACPRKTAKPTGHCSRARFA